MASPATPEAEVCLATYSAGVIAGSYCLNGSLNAVAFGLSPSNCEPAAPAALRLEAISKPVNAFTGLIILFFVDAFS
jgi:hypothetical protein